MSAWDFQDRLVVIATMHRKEEAIAPLLQAALGVKTWVPTDFDTDQFGTFTRDVKRPADQRATARLKIDHALAQTEATLGIASEGSFAPHPALPMVPLNRELVMLRDLDTDLELIGEAASTDTNFDHATIQSLEAAWEFAQKALFPSHGLVVMPSAEATQPLEQATFQSLIFKGIVDPAELEDRVSWMLATFGQAHLETDMRAMMNPTRMGAIAQATADLLRKFQQRCPQCGFPGFDQVAYHRGLPCSLCGMPTQLPLVAIAQCQACGHTHETLHPHGSSTANPAQCPFCNP